MPRKKTTDTAGISKAIQEFMVHDTFQNQLARTGIGMPNMMNATAYPMTRYTRNYPLLTSLYRNNWIVRRIIDVVPKDMTKNWYKYESDITPEEITRLHRAEKKTKIKASLRKALKWARLYGGSAALMMIDGQEDQLDNPLDIESIAPGDFKGLMVVDRWNGIFPGMDLVDDISDPEFGLPRTYQFSDNQPYHNGIPGDIGGYSGLNGSINVHHSRILRFKGDDLPWIETQVENHWGASKIEAIFEELKKRDNTSANLAGLIFLSNIRILKMADLAQMLTATDDKSKQDLYNTITAMNQLMNNFSLQVMDSEDDFQLASANFGGLSDIYELFMNDIAGASEIPATKLFGKSPDGMNATGEGDMRNYYDMIEGEQEEQLTPALEKLLPVLCMSELGKVPDDIDFSYNPLETPSDKDMADVVKARSEVIISWYSSGIISQKTALMEGKTLSEGTGLLTNITDDDINNADDSLIDTKSMMLGPMDDPEDNEKDNESP